MPQPIAYIVVGKTAKPLETDSPTTLTRGYDVEEHGLALLVLVLVVAAPEDEDDTGAAPATDLGRDRTVTDRPSLSLLVRRDGEDDSHDGHRHANAKETGGENDNDLDETQAEHVCPRGLGVVRFSFESSSIYRSQVNSNSSSASCKLCTG